VLGAQRKQFFGTLQHLPDVPKKPAEVSVDKESKANGRGIGGTPGGG
jgi:hypothetical protein